MKLIDIANAKTCALTKKKVEDNIKSRVQDICRAVLPVTESEAVVTAVDVVHRISRPKDGGSNNTMRPVIIKFLSRAAREALWRGPRRVAA